MGLQELADNLLIADKLPLTRQQLAAFKSGHILVHNTKDDHQRQFGECHECGSLDRVSMDLNLVKDGFDTFRIFFHELGHSFHFLNIRAKYQSLRMTMPRFFTEAVAQVFESLIDEPEWLLEKGGLDRGGATRIHTLWAIAEITAFRQTLPLLYLRSSSATLNGRGGILSGTTWLQPFYFQAFERRQYTCAAKHLFSKASLFWLKIETEIRPTVTETLALFACLYKWS